MIAKSTLRHVYHLVRGTARPKVSVLGAYPLDQDAFVLRFETSMPEALAERGAFPLVSVSGADATDKCIEMRRLDYTRGGIDLVKTAYSIALDYRFGSAEISLAGGGNHSVVSLSLTEDEARTLLDEFECEMRDAASDPRYEARAHAFSERAAPPADNDEPIDVAIVAYPADAAKVVDTVESLRMQGHRAWNACIVVPNAESSCLEILSALAESPQITLVGACGETLADAMNRAIALAEGHGMLFIRQGDILPPDALARFCEALSDGCGLAYCDVDYLDQVRERLASPRFKPRFSLDLLYSQNFIGDAFLVSREMLARMGERPVTADDSWSYELALRCAEPPAQAASITHIAHIGCHASAGDEAGENPRQDIRVLDEHFARRGIAACVQATDAEGVYRTTFPLKGDKPSISIVIPSKDHVDYLEPCIESILAKAGYEDYEVIVVENNSVDPATFAYYERVQRKDSRIKIADFTSSALNDGSFNFSRLVNFGAGVSEGDLLLILNNDTQAITPGFLPLLAGYLSRPEVGVVGALLRHSDGLVQHAGMAILESGRMGFMNQDLSPSIHRGYLNSLVSAGDFSCVLGACQMVSRKTFDAVGGYEEELAVTGNDIDFCWKVRQRGLSVVYTPHVEFFHKEFGTRKSDDADAEQEAQSAREVAFLVQRWPEYYRQGDGFINPNLDRESIYYQLAL